MMLEESPPRYGVAPARLCRNYSSQATVATNDGWSYDRYLVALCELELEERRQRGPNGSYGNRSCPGRRPGIRQSRLPRTVQRRVAATFWIAPRTYSGNPGSGKLPSGMNSFGSKNLLRSMCLLVQRLLRAKAELGLEKELKRLGSAMTINGYVQHSRDEMEVLFTLLAHRYERAS